MSDYKLPATYPDFDYTGEPRSGNFGPNSGRYAAYFQLGNAMFRFQDYRTGQTDWPTRAEAWQAAGSRISHTAVVGLPRP